jgi:hypothetical protein
MDIPLPPEQPDNLDRLRQRLPIGEGGLLPISKLGPPIKTGWALRRTDAQIQRIKRHPECKEVQGAGYWCVTLLPSRVEVRVAVMAIGFGLLPHGPDDISAAFVNEHDPVCRGLLENLTTQDTMPVLLIGDTEANDCIAGAKNTQRQWAQKALAAVSSLPPWTPQDFARAREVFHREFPTKMALWERFARQPE